MKRECQTPNCTWDTRDKAKVLAEGRVNPMHPENLRDSLDRGEASPAQQHFLMHVMDEAAMLLEVSSALIPALLLDRARQDSFDPFAESGKKETVH